MPKGWHERLGGRALADSILNILALQYPDSGKLSTDVLDVDTGIDWLVYPARYSQQCQAQSHFVVRSRLDIVENTEIMAGPNPAFYCGTLRPDYRPFRTGIFIQTTDGFGKAVLVLPADFFSQLASLFSGWGQTESLEILGKGVFVLVRNMRQK